jgi:hypothetical protein
MSAWPLDDVGFIDGRVDVFWGLVEVRNVGIAFSGWKGGG